MRKLLLLLLIVFVATQKKPRPKFKIIRTLNVTKAVGFELHNKTENYPQEIAKLDIPQKIKDMASKVNLTKKDGNFIYLEEEEKEEINHMLNFIMELLLLHSNL